MMNTTATADNWHWDLKRYLKEHFYTEESVLDDIYQTIKKEFENDYRINIGNPTFSDQVDNKIEFQLSFDDHTDKPQIPNIRQIIARAIYYYFGQNRDYLLEGNSDMKIRTSMDYLLSSIYNTYMMFDLLYFPIDKSETEYDIIVNL